MSLPRHHGPEQGHCHAGLHGLTFAALGLYSVLLLLHGEVSEPDAVGNQAKDELKTMVPPLINLELTPQCEFQPSHKNFKNDNVNNRPHKQPAIS